MAKANDVHKARRRANWVALRTFQRRVEVVGETEQGEPIVEVDSVRLVLPFGGQHFRHLVVCSRCGREVAGEPLFATAHLNRNQNRVFCGECTQRPGDSPRTLADAAEEASEPPEPVFPAVLPGGASAGDISFDQRAQLVAEGGDGFFGAGIESEDGTSWSPTEEGTKGKPMAEGAGADEDVHGDTRPLERPAGPTEAPKASEPSPVRAIVPDDEPSLREGAIVSDDDHGDQLADADGGEGEDAASSARRDSPPPRVPAAPPEAAGTDVGWQQKPRAARPPDQDGRELVAQLRSALAGELAGVARQVEAGQQAFLTQLGPTVRSELEKQREALAAELRAEVGSELARDLQGQVLALTQQLQAAHQGLTSQLAETLGARLEEHRQSLTEELGTRENPPAPEELTALLTEVLAARLDEHRHELVAELGSGLGSELEGKLGRTLRDQVDTVGRQVDSGHLELATLLESAVQTRLEQHGQELASELGVVMEGRLERHRQELAAELQAEPADDPTEGIREELASLARQSEAGLQQLASQLADRLEHHRGELVAEMGAGLDAKLKDGLKDHAAAVTRQLAAGQEDIAARVGSAVEERLAQHRVELAAGQEDIAGRLGSAVEERLAQHRVELAAELKGVLASELEASQRDLVSIVSDEIAGGFDRHGDDLATELGSLVASEFTESLQGQSAAFVREFETGQRELAAQLGRAVGRRLEQHRQQLASEVWTAATAELGERIHGQVGSLALEFSQAQEKLFTELEELLRTHRGLEQQELTAHSASTRSDVESRLLATEKQLSEQLDRLARSAAAAGIAAAGALLRRTEERVYGNVAAQIGQLQAEIVTTRNTMMDLRRTMATNAGVNRKAVKGEPVRRAARVVPAQRVQAPKPPSPAGRDAGAGAGGTGGPPPED